MPLYEYQCQACHARFERIQKFSDPLVSECPKCGKGPVEKLVSSPAFHLKGTGWYATDYSKKDSGKEERQETKEERRETKDGSKEGEKPAEKASEPPKSEPSISEPAAPEKNTPKSNP